MDTKDCYRLNHAGYHIKHASTKIEYMAISGTDSIRNGWPAVMIESSAEVEELLDSSSSGLS